MFARSREWTTRPGGCGSIDSPGGARPQRRTDPDMRRPAPALAHVLGAYGPVCRPRFSGGDHGGALADGKAWTRMNCTETSETIFMQPVSLKT